MWHLDQPGTEENEKAKVFFRRAIEPDPMLPAAYVSMTIAMIYDLAVYGAVPADASFHREAANWPRKAIAIDAGNADALAALGWVIGGSGALMKRGRCCRKLATSALTRHSLTASRASISSGLVNRHEDAH